MSSNCPPQLHLELPPSTTSFKRSFDQFGFDLESPLGASDSLGASSSDGNDRNKRARSASSFSDDHSLAGSSSSSTLASGASSMGNPVHAATPGSRSGSMAPRSPSTLAAPLLSLNLPHDTLEPPRLPTPEIQDIDMSDYPLPGVEEPRSPAPLPSTSTHQTASQAEDNYRLALERFSTFESQISALRRSPSPSLTRSETPPYVLPPLQLSGDGVQLGTNTLLRHLQRSPRLPDSSSQVEETGIVRQDESRRDNSRPSTSQSRQGDSRNVQRNSPRPHAVWSQVTRDERTGVVGGRRVVWPNLFQSPASQTRNNQDSEESDESTYPITVRPGSPIPVISELRTPSPLFDLEELQNQASATTTGQNPPPTLPPIHGHDETWELGVFAWDDTRTDSSTSAFRRTLQPPALSRISIPRDLPLTRDRSEDRPTGSTSESSSSSHNHQTHTLPSPFSRDLTGWMESGHSDSSWFVPSPAEEHSSPDHLRNTNAGSDNSTQTHNPSTHSPSDSYTIPSFAPSRLDTLHGLGEALQGIGRALQESELTLRPFLLDNYPAAENNRHTSIRLPSLEGASSTDSRPAYRRSNGSASIPGSSEARQDDDDPLATRRRSRLSVSSLPSPLENHMRPWLADRSRAASPLPATEPSMPLENGGESNTRYSTTEHSRRISSPEPPARRRRTGSTDSFIPLRWQSSLAPSWFHAADDPMASGPSSLPDAEPLAAAESGSRSEMFPEGSSDPFSRSGRILQTGMHEFQARDPLAPNDVSQSHDEGSMPTHTIQNATDHYSNTGSLSRAITNETTRTRPRHFWPSNRVADAGLFGPRQVPTHARSASSSALNASYVSTSNLLRLRSRPYANQPGAHTHSHSIPSGHSNHLHSTPAESLSDARRRTARLGLIQSQRQARAPPVEPPHVLSNWRSLHRHGAPHETELQHTSRLTPPARSVFNNVYMSRRAANQSNRDAVPRLPTQLPSYLGDTTTDSDRRLMPRPTDTTMETLAGRLHRPSGHRVEHHPPNRVETNTSGGELPSLNINNHRRQAVMLRDFVLDHNFSRQADTSLERQSFRDFLPVPSLPSPEFDGVFNFAGSHDTDEGNAELRHPAPASEQSPPITRRSTSPIRVPEPRQHDQSPPQRLSPTRTFLRRDFNPEIFAPGPFRNTIQRLHDVNMAREARTGEIQRRGRTGAEYTAPSIPPLSFEDDFRASSLYLSDSRDMDAETSHNRHSPPLNLATEPATPSRNMLFSGRRHWTDDFDDDQLDLAPIQARRNAWRPAYRPSQAPHSATNPETSNRPSDLHNFLSRYPRIEASRLDNSNDSHASSSRGDEDGLHHALEVLRHDGLSLPRSQELINRYHRDRHREARTANTSASPWGILEQGGASSRRTAETTSNEPPYGRTWRRARPGFLMGFDHMSEDSETASSISNREPERTRLLRGRRFRMPNYDMGPVFPHGVHEFIRMGGARRGRPIGDYIRDEDFDESYESLLSLAATLGDVKPRCTPDSVIAGLETGLYKDWKNSESDHRCSICLDDYQPEDVLLKLTDCSHWLHRECLQQWLKSASTCPVCRKPVTGDGSSTRCETDHSNEAGPSRRRDNSGDGPSDHPPPPNNAGSSNRPAINQWLQPYRYM